MRAGQDLAEKTGGECHAAVLGKGIDALANELAEYGVKKVFAVDDPALEHYVADAYAQALSQPGRSTRGCDVVVATATAIGKDLMPRVAVRLDAGMASDITGVNADGTFERPMYAGNVIATVAIERPQKVVTVRATAFDAAAKSGKGEVEKVAAKIDRGALKMKFVSFNETKSDRPVLTEARIVVSGGRGLKNGENFTTVLEPLVDALGAAMGASRAAVDAGFVPERPAGRPDRQGGRAGALHRRRHLRRHPAPRRHEGLEGHRRHQQGRGGADLPGRRLRPGRRSLQGRAGDEGRGREAEALRERRWRFAVTGIGSRDAAW